MDCEHKKAIIPDLMRSPNKSVALIECAECERIIGNCRWDNPDDLEMQLVFSPTELATKTFFQSDLVA